MRPRADAQANGHTFDEQLPLRSSIGGDAAMTSRKARLSPGAAPALPAGGEAGTKPQHSIGQGRSMRRFTPAPLAAAALLALAACNASTDKPASGAGALPAVELPEMSLPTLQEVTKELSQDSYEGRAPGTAGEEKTVSYLIRKFTEAGLKPGNNGSWTQDVPLVEITAKNVSPLSFAGGKTPMSLKYGADF